MLGTGNTAGCKARASAYPGVRIVLRKGMHAGWVWAVLDHGETVDTGLRPTWTDAHLAARSAIADYRDLLSGSHHKKKIS